MPFDFIQSIVDLVTPKAIQRKKSMNELGHMRGVIEAYNECDEKIHIQLERSIQVERNMDLEVLITKCKRLLSFVDITGGNQTFDIMRRFVEKVRQAKYRGDDIKYLFQEFEDIETSIKKSSKSFNNLSSMGMLG
jgi:hypothetical protein